MFLSAAQATLIGAGQNVRVVFINNYTVKEPVTAQQLLSQIMEGELVFVDGPEVFQILAEDGTILAEEK